MVRKVPEWIGKSSDEKVPKRVHDRVVERYNRKCYLTGVLLAPGTDYDLDHIVALANGGKHRESNLAPALRDAHRRKTASDVKIKSKIAAVIRNHIKPRVVDDPPKMQGPPMPTTRKAATRAERGHKPAVVRKRPWHPEEGLPR